MAMISVPTTCYSQSGIERFAKKEAMFAQKIITRTYFECALHTVQPAHVEPGWTGFSA